MRDGMHCSRWSGLPAKTISMRRILTASYRHPDPCNGMRAEMPITDLLEGTAPTDH